MALTPDAFDDPLCAPEPELIRLDDVDYGQINIHGREWLTKTLRMEAGSDVWGRFTSHCTAAGNLAASGNREWVSSGGNASQVKNP